MYKLTSFVCKDRRHGQQIKGAPRIKAPLHILNKCNLHTDTIQTFASHDLSWIKRWPSKHIVGRFTVETLSSWTCQLIPREHKWNNATQQVECSSSFPGWSLIDCNLQVQLIHPDVVVGQQLHKLVTLQITATGTRLHTHDNTTQVWDSANLFLQYLLLLLLLLLLVLLLRGITLQSSPNSLTFSRISHRGIALIFIKLEEVHRQAYMYSMSMSMSMSLLS